MQRVSLSFTVQAHLKADKFYSVVANMRGSSPQEVAHKILSSEALRGLQVHLTADNH